MNGMNRDLSTGSRFLLAALMFFPCFISARPRAILRMMRSGYDLNIFTVVPSCTPTLSPLFPKRTYTLASLVRRIRTGKIEPAMRLQIKGKQDTEPKRVVDLFGGIVPVCTDRIVIFSRGHIPWTGPWGGTPRCGGGICWVHRLIQNDILADATWVTFDYVDHACLTDFGQSYDQEILQSIIQAVKKINPHVHITLAGDCRGAHAILRYLTEHDDATIDTLILESPYERTSELIATISESYVAPFLGRYAQSFFDRFFRWLYPSYNPAQDNLLASIAHIKNKKIFIGHHLNDPVISQTNVMALIASLREHNDVYFFSSDHAAGSHSRLSLIPTYQKAVNAFCALQALPHHEWLAQQGVHLLPHLQNHELRV